MTFTRRFSSLFILIALISSITAYAKKQTSIALTMKPDPDNCPVGQVEIERKTIHATQNQKNTINEKITFVLYHCFDTQYEDKNYGIELIFDSVFVEQKNSLTPPLFIDSLSRIVNNALGGNSVYMDITPRWQIIHVEGAEDIKNQIYKRILKAPEFTGNEPVVDMIAQQFSSNFFSQQAVTNLFHYISGGFPEDSVSIGDTWKHSSLLDFSYMPISDTTEYTLVDIKEETITIEFKSTLTNDKYIKPFKAGPVEYIYSLGGELKGTMLLDGSTYWVKEMNVYQELDGIYFPKIEHMETPEGAEVPTRIITKVTLKSI